MKKSIVTIQIDSNVYKQFADDLALDMLSRGYDVRSITVARNDGTSLHWEPKYALGERVRIEGTDGAGYLGIVLEVRAFNGERMQYRIQWDDADTYGTLWCDENEIEKVAA